MDFLEIIVYFPRDFILPLQSGIINLYYHTDSINIYENIQHQKDPGRKNQCWVAELKERGKHVLILITNRRSFS